jgi:hypothetical protein
MTNANRPINNKPNSINGNSSMNKDKNWAKRGNSNNGNSLINSELFKEKKPK